MALPSLNNDASFVDVVRQSTGVQKDQMKLELQNLSTLGEIKSILKLQYEEQLAFRAEQRAAAEEARREALNKLKPEKDKKTADTGSPGGDATSSFGALTILAGLLASFVGLDDVIRTIQLPKTIKAITGFSKMVGAVTRTAAIYGGVLSLEAFEKAQKGLRRFANFIKPLTDFLTRVSEPIRNFTAARFKIIQKRFINFIDVFLNPLRNFLSNIQGSVNNLKKIAFAKIAPIFKTLSDFFQKSTSFIQNTSKTLGGFKTTTFTKAQSAFKPFADFMKGVVRFVNNGRIYIGVLSLEVFEKAQKAFKSFTNFMKPVTNFLVATGKVLRQSDIVAGALNAASRAVSSFTRFLSPVLNFFRGTSKVLGPAMKVITPILRIGGRVFLGPILAVIDFIQGFIKGFGGEDGSLIKGLFFGLTEIFKGFVTYPLDLIKSGISWLLGKLGFKVAEDALDSFTFSGGVDRFVEGITEDPLGMIAKVVMLPYDLIKGGISWLLGKFGFKGGVEVLDNFSFGDTFGKLIKGELNLMDKVMNFFSKLGKGFMSIFDFIPSVEDIVLAAIDSLPGGLIKSGAIQVAKDLGLISEGAGDKLDAMQARKELDATAAKIAELEGRKATGKNKAANEKSIANLKKERDELQKKMRVLEAKAAVAEDGRSMEELEKQYAENKQQLETLKDIEEARGGLSPDEEKIRARLLSERDDILDASRPAVTASVADQEEQAEKIAKQRLGNGNDFIGRDKFNRLSEGEKAQLIRVIMDEMAVAKGGIGADMARMRLAGGDGSGIAKSSAGIIKSIQEAQRPGIAIDRASKEVAANQNQQVNVVSAPQTDASVNNQTTNNYAAPGPAQSRNPDSEFRRASVSADY